MNQFYISCKESRIENNRSFYGCFYLGPFDSSQSLTIANTLRRTLLSELSGLAIISVEIENVAHEYTTLTGMKESVLDLLLNLKEIVLKKTKENITTQIGYLKVHGPGVVNASHLRLPPFIQCVDPNQYIATLAENGFLNMRFTIHYGNKWIKDTNLLYSSKTKSDFEINNDLLTLSEKEEGTSSLRLDFGREERGSSLGEFPKGKKIKSNQIFINSESNFRKKFKFIKKNSFNLYFKNRRFFLKKLKEIGITGSQNYIHLFLKNLNRLNFYKKNDFTNLNLLSSYNNAETLNSIFKIRKKFPGLNFKKLPFIPFKKNFIKEQLLKTTLPSSTKDKEVKNSQNEKVPKKIFLFEKTEKHEGFSKKKKFLNSKELFLDSIFNPINKVNYIIETNDLKLTESKLQKALKFSEFYETIKKLKNFKVPSATISEAEQEGTLRDTLLEESKILFPFENYKDIQNLPNQIEKEFKTSSIKEEFNNLFELNDKLKFLKTESVTHNIILEIWTNGSIHPRDALYQAFTNLVKLFSNLTKIQPLALGGVDNRSLETKMNLKKGLGEDIQNRAIKPINQTSFLSIYISPKIKQYYLNK